MIDALDLSGEWRGIFSYPAMLRATGFDAVLGDRGGLLSGTITEVAQAGEDHGRTIDARIDGRRDGRSVAFAKLYDGADGYDIVAYRGEVAPDGDEIAGRWTIPGAWSGSFIMTRARGVATAAEARTAEPVR